VARSGSSASASNLRGGLRTSAIPTSVFTAATRRSVSGSASTSRNRWRRRSRPGRRSQCWRASSPGCARSRSSCPRRQTPPSGCWSVRVLAGPRRTRRRSPTRLREIRAELGGRHHGDRRPPQIRFRVGAVRADRRHHRRLQRGLALRLRYRRRDGIAIAGSPEEEQPERAEPGAHPAEPREHGD